MSNIVGEDHLDYVKNQITARQEILGKTTREPEDIVWQNNRNAWIRLISSVDIADEDVLKYNAEIKQDEVVSNNGAEFRNEYLGLEGYGGPMLSQESILQGGTLNYDQPKFGVANNNSNLPNSNFNYGYGGNEFGLKPMPGITSFSSKTYNKGSLRKAQLQITAHNRTQFQYLDSVYLRLGYTMLLEWGNTKFPIKENDGSIRYATQADISSLSLKDEFLYSYDLGSSYFYTRIEELREQSQGNYDGFLGRVDNFSWEFTKEGTYLITLDLISIGSIIESLKINTILDSINYPNPPNQSEDESNDPDVERPSSLEVFIDLATSFQIATLESTVSNTVGSRDLGEGGTARSVSNTTRTTKELQLQKFSLTDEESKALDSGDFSDGGLALAINAIFGENGRKLKKYLRLKTLLDFMNTKLLLYSRSNTPLIKIDTTIDTLCYSNGFSFSGDPSKMVNNLSLQIGQEEIKVFDDPNIAQFHDKLEDNTLVGRVMNLYFERDYLINLVKDKTDEEGNLPLYDFLKSITNSINSLLGGVNKLNVRLVEKKFDYLLNNQVSGSRIEEVLEIYDEVPFKKIDTNPIFNIYGFNPNESKTIETIDKDGNPTQNTITYNGGSFITDFNLKTEITKNLSSQIAIGAQATGRALGEDSTVFSKWNIGLIDRILPSKLDIDKAKQDTASSRTDFRKLQASYKKYLDQLKGAKITEGEIVEGDEGSIRFGGGTNLVDYKVYLIPNLFLNTTQDQKATFSKFENIQKQFFNKVLAYDAERKGITTPFIGFIPISLSLTMDGLSGIRIFDKLTVNSKYLPKNYTDTLNFIITSLDHKFEQNKWVTQVGTLSIPKLFDKTPEVATENILLANVSDLREEENRGIRGSKDIPSYFVLNNKRLTSLNNTTGYWALDYKTQSSEFITFTRERVSNLEEEVLQYYNPLVRNNFKQFLNDLLQILPKGYEFRINSVVRSFADQIRVYLSKAQNPSLSSMHLWGTAIDISIWEAGSIDGNGKFLYGMGESYFEKWKELGIEDLAIKNKLRWGGTFSDFPYDNVHFDARNIVLSEGWTKEKAKKAVIEAFPALKPYINDSFKFSKNKAISEDLRIALDSFTLEGDAWSIDKNLSFKPIKIDINKINFDGTSLAYPGSYYKGVLNPKD